MAFLKKIFKGKTPKEDLDPESGIPVFGQVQDSPEIGAERKADLSEYRVNTIKVDTIQIGEESGRNISSPPAPVDRSGGGDVPGFGASGPGAGLEDLAEKAPESPVLSAAEGSKESAGVVGGLSIQDDLLGVFEEEMVVDEQLEALSSRVEEVEAEELVEELRAFIEDIAAR